MDAWVQRGKEGVKKYFWHSNNPFSWRLECYWWYYAKNNQQKPSTSLWDMCPSLSPRGQGTSSPVSFEGFRGALYSSFTLGAHNFFLDQLRGVSLALSCQIPPKGNCSMWSYRFPNAIGFGRLEETVTYLSPSLWQFFRRTKWHSSSKIEVPFFHLLLEFSKKTKRFSYGKRLKVGCPETPKTQKILMTNNGLNLS